MTVCCLASTLFSVGVRFDVSNVADEIRETTDRMKEDEHATTEALNRNLLIGTCPQRDSTSPAARPVAQRLHPARAGGCRHYGRDEGAGCGLWPWRCEPARRRTGRRDGQRAGRGRECHCAASGGVPRPGCRPDLCFLPGRGYSPTAAGSGL